MDKIRLIEICEQVALDVENDAKEFDGKPLTGKIVAEYFGNHGAAIAALANVIKELIENTIVPQSFEKPTPLISKEDIDYLSKKK